MTQSIDQKIALAMNLHQKNHFAEAEAAYIDVLREEPTHYEALYCLSLLYESVGYFEKTIELLREVVRLYPQSIDAHYNLGLILFKLKRYEEAISIIDHVLTIDPGHCSALNVRGLINYETGRYEEALDYFNKILTINPDHISALNGMGLTLKELYRYQEALDVFERALALSPANHMLLYNKSLVLFYLEQYTNVIFNLDQILTEIEPNYIKALNGKASALVRLHRKNEVVECYTKIVALNPKHNTARSELLYNLLCICEWEDIDRHTRALNQAVTHYTLNEEDTITPLIAHLLPGLTLANHYEWSHRYAMQITDKMTNLKQQLAFAFNKDTKSMLKIGYISADFREHPLSQLIPEVLELHDRKHFTIYAYSYGPDDKHPMRARIEKAVDYFIDIRNRDAETIAKHIVNDGIDILIDLTGFAWLSPTHVLALRVAPVQASYLGYLGTMAADFVDAIIVDKFLVPPEQQSYYTEKVYYLPCYQANDRQCPVGQKPSRASCDLPENAFVFCCFNSNYKITPAVFAVWCKLLQQIPDSVLWLQASNEWAVKNLQKEAQQHGVDPACLIFANKIPLDQHLARLQCADLFLDTHPYNAGTTASNTLWVGVPIVTYAGETLSSRMAGSLLTALQTPELITYNLDDYYQLALTLATNHEKRRAITDKIKANRDTTILFDTPFLTRHLEEVYIQMWNNYLKN